MTGMDKLVTVTTWSQESIAKTLEAFSMGLGRAEERGAKWMRILASATELFTRQGFRKTSVSEIAEHAHVAKGTVYLYFDTKAGILLHAIVEEKKKYLGRLAPVMAPGLEPAERLRTYLRLILILASEMPLVSRILSGDREVLTALEEKLDPDLRAQMQELQMDFLSELLDGAAAPHRWTEDEVRDRAKAILALLYSSAFVADEKARLGLSVERFAGLLADMIVDGIRRVSPERVGSVVESTWAGDTALGGE